MNNLPSNNFRAIVFEKICADDTVCSSPEIKEN
jgi:hypothetical protein